MKTAGPTTVTVPRRLVTVCTLCKWHVCTDGLFTRAGPGGWREYSCTHPGAWPNEIDPARAEVIGYCKAKQVGRVIGRTNETPAWCPLRNDGKPAV